MRKTVFAFRSRTVCNVALVAAIAGMSAACSNSQRLQQPFFTSSTDNQKQIIGATDQPMPAPLDTGEVTRRDLPPPSRQAAYAEPIPLGSEGTPPASAFIDGPFTWTAVGGAVITVTATDTLQNIAVKYGVPPEQILAANQLASASQITAGRILVIPRRVPIAKEEVERTIPVATTTTIPESPAATITAGAGSHVVQAGDTLYGISRRYDAKIGDIVALNGLASPEAIRIGQTLTLPGGASAPMAATAGAADASAKPTQIASADPTVKIPAAASETGSVAMTARTPQIPAAATPAIGPDAETIRQTAAIDAATDQASADGTSFRWPVRGRIISGFGSKPNGERNDGINLAVPEGTSVKAVEAGTVIYAGNELEGYGNLVLVRHADGWVSAYAHNKEILVKRGDRIGRGQTLAHAGMTGSVTAPQVHFELRKGAKPVNPLDYLAGA
jgi:murein DD-endopeptidase MepM/ murein hydrolase activator NlpD